MQSIKPISLTKKSLNSLKSSLNKKKVGGAFVIIIGLMVSSFSFAADGYGSKNIGGGSFGAGAGAGHEQQTSIGNKSVNMGVGASASIDICMPTFKVPAMPSLNIDITKPTIPIPHLEISLADPRELFWMIIDSYREWLADYIASLEKRVKDEVCGVIKYVRLEANEIYGVMRSGAFNGFDEYITKPTDEFAQDAADMIQPWTNDLTSYAGSKLEKDYSKVSIKIAEKLVISIESFVGNAVNKTFYNSDYEMQQLRQRYLGEIETMMCGYSNANNFGSQPYDKRMLALEELSLEFDIEMVDISGLINSVIDKAAEMIQEKVAGIMNDLIKGMSMPMLPPICFSIQYYCFCVDFYSNVSLENMLSDAYEDLSEKLWEHADDMKIDPIPNKVSAGYSSLSNMAFLQVEHRRNFEETLLEEMINDGSIRQAHLNPTSESDRIYQEEKRIYKEVAANTANLIPYTEQEAAEPYANRINPDYRRTLPWIPSDNELWNADNISIVRMFQQSRLAMKEHLSAAAVRMLAQEMDWMENARALLITMTEASGDVNRAGNMKHDILSQRAIIDIERKILESSLRQEVFLSIIIITKRGLRTE